MKISILLPPYINLNLEYHGGLERMALDELDYLKAHGAQVAVYASNIKGEYENVYRTLDLGWKHRILKYFYYLLFLLRSIRYDIFHGYYCPIIALVSPRKSVIHYQGVGLGELVLYRYKLAQRRYCKSNYIFCSQWVKNHFAQKYPEIPHQKLHVIYNGVDTKMFRPAIRKIKKEKINICFYGRWIEEKGPLDVLKAVGILEAKGRRDFTLWFAGSAKLATVARKETVMDQRLKKNTDELICVRMKGEISREEMPVFLRDMDIGLFPTNTSEPFGIAMIEMMSAGLPVIAYDVDGPREVIVNNNTGFLVENKRPDLLAEKIEWFLDNRQAIAEMGANARKHVEDNFSLEKHGRELQLIYSMINNK